MNEIELAEFRVKRLADAIDRVCGGDRSAFGRRLGYRDGAFVRQMLSGKRSISEKTVRQIEDLPGMKGWFSEGPGSGAADASRTNMDAEKLWKQYMAASESTRMTVEYLLRAGGGRVPEWVTPALAQSIQSVLAHVEERLAVPDRSQRRPTGTG